MTKSLKTTDAIDKWLNGINSGILNPHNSTDTIKTTHELKIKSEYFMDVARCQKRAEIRYNDRNYKVGDTLNLYEIDKFGNRTGRKCSVIISHILDDAEYLRDGYVMLSIEVIY